MFFGSKGNILILYCHRGEQVHIMCAIEELIPSIGTPVPSPSILAVIICQSDSTFQNVGKLYSDVSHSPSPDVDFDTPFDFCDEPLLVSKTHLISISDDGKIWNWLLTAEGPENTQKDDRNLGLVADVSEVPVPGTNANTVISSSSGSFTEAGKQPEHMDGGRNCPSNSTSSLADMSFKVCL